MFTQAHKQFNYCKFVLKSCKTIAFSAFLQAKLLGLPRRFASEVPMFFPEKITSSALEIKNAITFKQFWVET